MAVKAVAKGVRLSPRKVAVVADLVRGRSVEDALTILEHTPRRSATAVKKAIMSAKANGATYAQMLAAGWTDVTLAQHGMFA